MRRFFDTNVLVYLFDASAPRKKARVQELLKQAVDEGLALLSTQVLLEFFVAVTCKLSAPLPPEQAERAVRNLAKLPTVQVDAEMILQAIETMRRYWLWVTMLNLTPIPSCAIFGP